MYLKKILLIIILLSIAVLGWFSYTVYTSIFSPNTGFKEERKELYIPTNASYEAVRDTLEPLLLDMDSFDAIAKRKGYMSNVKAGRYFLKNGMNNNDLVNTLRSGNQPVSVTFNNQERIENLAGRVATQIEADSITLLNAMRDPDFLQNHGFDQETALSMYLPNKYEFYWNTSAEKFRDRMYEEYQRFWTEERKTKAKALALTPQQVITLASIVQKESVKIDERPRVAGVYLNRYERGIKLDADPTVIYSIKRAYKNYDTIIKRVLYRDLELDSPYNTYRVKGLPPGPITMPDISAIDAVLNPEDHNYLFFVADVSRPGYHLFAETNRQHNNNRKQYRRWIDKLGIRR
ncbi:endolytic transglycosylase MltG [Gangjinia marincola]|uniref:Endolytic murein transglycosylase n=1 Tax=Gangjinia marincola TaxID=578463 RepID=A0ABN1MEV8_9FLAO